MTGPQKSKNKAKKKKRQENGAGVLFPKTEGTKNTQKASFPLSKKHINDLFTFSYITSFLFL